MLGASEELVLPKDEMWPFLLRFPVSAFGICFGLSSQAILWKTLATSASTSFLNVSLNINFVLWCISVVLMIIVSFIYSMKVIFYFEAVRREYYHPVRVNFFFAPWIALLFLTLGVPPSLDKHLHSFCWYILMAPILCLDLKIYGQWMSGGQRRLSKVANPSNFRLEINSRFPESRFPNKEMNLSSLYFDFGIIKCYYFEFWVEKMKEIAKLKANEERERLESELELVLIVEKLQELRSIRIQKLKKQGNHPYIFFSPSLLVSLVTCVLFYSKITNLQLF